MASLDSLRFVFVTGKGGVGKSTVTASLAVSLAARGRRVLVTSTDAKERLSLLLGAPPLEPEVRELRARIWGVKLEPSVALREYGAMILKSRALTSAVFDSRYTRGFFAGVPGLSEWAMLGKAWYHAIEEAPGGGPRFDTVLFDAPATGHGLDMLRVPRVIVEIVPPGVLRRDAERAWAMFQDPRQSGVVVVTLAEDMPANETVELCQALGGELGLPLTRIVVNALVEPLFTEVERGLLLQPRSLDRDLPGNEAIACGVRRAIRERVQEESLAKLRALPGERIELPLLFDYAPGPPTVAKLAELLR
ncbi:MAG: ArsA family ATPase [Polyangiaceae bacterium]|nr:ArsA family ATPase [Polyangiaceae bacterium]